MDGGVTVLPVIIFLLFLHSFQNLSSSIFSGLSILLEDGNEAPSTVNVIENTRFELYCDGGGAFTQRIVWRKVEDGDFEILNSNLTFSNIQEVHAGTYQCADEDYNLLETVTIRILCESSMFLLI